MYGRHLLILGMWLLAAAGMVAGAAAKERTWTDTSGRTIRGEFVRELGDEVALLVDGKLVTIPLDKLSPRDREAVRELAAGREVPDDPPPLPAPVAEPATPVEAPSSPSAPEAEIDVTPVPAATTPATTPPAFSPPPAATDDEPSEPSPAPSLVPGRRAKAPANRTWTDTQGRQVTGKFVRVFNGKVMISRPGRIVPVGFYDLSDADQQYVKDLLIERGEESLIPPKPVPQVAGGVGGSAAIAGEAASNIPAGAIEIAPAAFPEYQPMPASTTPDYAGSSSGAIEYSGAPPAGYGPEMNAGSTYNPGSVEVMPPDAVSNYGPASRARPRFNPSPAEDTSAERVGICSGCNREVRGMDTYFDKCPHCGTHWSYNEFHDGENAGKFADRLGGAAIAAIAAVVVAVAMLAGVIGIVMAIAKASRSGQQYKHPRYGPPRY
jgi:hypothetical protein